MGWISRRVDRSTGRLVDGTGDVESRVGECTREGWIGGLVDRSTGRRVDRSTGQVMWSVDRLGLNITLERLSTSEVEDLTGKGVDWFMRIGRTGEVEIG